jgi:glycosyltransferase involved in cell wall biosynthesis
MKILWMSDSPLSPTGYGNVTRFVCAGLAAAGHQVMILGWQHLELPVAWQQCTLFPVRRHDNFGAEVLLDYLRWLRPDVLVTLGDIENLGHIAEPEISDFRQTAAIPWMLYYPISGDMGDGRLPPEWVRILKTVDLPIAMSDYGHHVTHLNGVMSAYIPHGVDTRVFRPPADKGVAKRALGYDGRFVVLSDARNQPRKLLPHTLEIFRRFAAGKDDAVLHLHCDSQDHISRSRIYNYDLRSDIAFLGLANMVRITDGFSTMKGIPLEELAAIYQAADVHLLSSWGEGFGLPTLQATAAGLVPLAVDYSASRELVRGHGEAIRVKHFVEEYDGLQCALIDIDDAVSRLQCLYQDRQMLESKSRAAERFAAAYDWQRIVPQWHELLEREVPRLLSRMRRRDSNAGALPCQLDEVATPQIAGPKLKLPVTLPPAAPHLASKRITGYVFAAGNADVAVVRTLNRIFPGLRVWSSLALELDSTASDNKPLQVEVVPADSPAYWRALAASTLTLDLEGIIDDLPLQSAELAVPSIGLNSHADQARLWPDLSLEYPDPAPAAMLARWMLTDQGDAAAACKYAAQQLAGRATPAIEGAIDRSSTLTMPIGRGEKLPERTVEFAIMTVARPRVYVHDMIAALRPDLPLRLIAGAPDYGYLERYRGHPFREIIEVPEVEWEHRQRRPVHDRGCWNYWRSLTLGIRAVSGKGLTVLEDDVIPALGWESRFHHTVNQIEAVYRGPFVLALHTPVRIPRPSHVTTYYLPYPVPSFYGTQAIYYPDSVRLRFADYLKRRGVDEVRLPYDVLLKEYLLKEGVPLFAAIPCLFQPIGGDQHSSR